MPRIKTTRTVTVALYLLRIYLLAMLLIILAKFVVEARNRGGHDTGAPAATGQNAVPAAESQQKPEQPTPIRSHE
ncbi:MAG: hypothetical protein ABSG53_30665 [Thermoguttaceae bacterium]|jgi:hypothetical protein